MRAWMILPLILFFHLGSLIASTPSDWFLQPEELARLKNSGITENVIQTKVEQQQLLLSEKWTQAQRFQFAPKVIPSAGNASWSIYSGPEMLLELRGDGGYLSAL